MGDGGAESGTGAEETRTTRFPWPDSRSPWKGDPFAVSPPSPSVEEGSVEGRTGLRHRLDLTRLRRPKDGLWGGCGMGLEFFPRLASASGAFWGRSAMERCRIGTVQLRTYPYPC